MEAMLERFVKLKECIVKAFADIGCSYMWNDDSFPKIIELSEALGPVRLAAEALGRKDANLLTSEGVFEFLFAELQQLKTEIISKLLIALKKRIDERRQTVLVSLMIYLQNPQNFISDIQIKSSAFFCCCCWCCSL